MKEYGFRSLERIVKKFPGKRLLVLGDLLLDQFIWGDVSRISPEAPVPVVWVKKEDHMPGGACNVASNLAKLGADVSIVGIVGNDDNGRILKELMSSIDVGTEGVVVDKERPTILKTRVIAHHQQVVRIDREDPRDFPARDMSRIKDYLKNNIKGFDGVIIEDYGKGVVTSELLRMVVPLAKRHGKMVAVDPKENHFSYYKGASVITPNHHEASKAVGFAITDEASMVKAGNKLIKKLNLDVVLLTLGENGMMVVQKAGAPKTIPTAAQEVFDVSGAGDTVIAVYTLSMVSGGNPIVAAHIANCAAGIVVGKVGTATVTRAELLERLKKETLRGRGTR
ncbi:MAG: D-glycero-beta-D-manno-heptose-7-phosphate kinase [Candidatus Omnitrophota bacterium]